MKTPIFGGFAQGTKSLNLVDCQCINLAPQSVMTRQGRAVGALYLTSGLTLFAQAGNGPIWGMHVFAGKLYVVSGNQVYVANPPGGVPQFVGNISGVSGPVTMQDNGVQMGIFTSTGGWLVSIHGSGQPLTGGTVGSGGTSYTVGDVIYLSATAGVQGATAAVTVTTVSGTAVTGFSIKYSGSFSTLPTGLTQLSTTGSGSGFTITSPTFGFLQGLYPIPLPFVPTAGTISAAQLDGFLLINQPGTNTWFQSSLSDMSIWDNPLAFGSASGNPDPIANLQELHREIFVTLTYETEVWVNAGTSPFAFQRLEGVYIEAGTQAPGTIVQVGETLMWLAQDRNGAATVIQLVGYQPKNVSDESVVAIWQSYATVSDAIAYSYEEANHTYYVISFPSGNTTWAYDVTESQLMGVPIWHQRASFSSGVFSRHWAQVALSSNQGQLYPAGQMVLGDYRNGNLYIYGPNNLLDNNSQRKWLRTWRAMPPGQANYDPQRFTQLQIDLETGSKLVPPEISTPAIFFPFILEAGGTILLEAGPGSIILEQGTEVYNPLVVLRWSDDGGHTWSNERYESAGPVGKTKQRVIFRRLGSTRRNSGLDRIFELSSSDQFPAAIMNAELL